MSRYQYLPLTPQEAYLLSRIDGILDVDSLLKIAGASRLATGKILYALDLLRHRGVEAGGRRAAAERPRRLPRPERRSRGRSRGPVAGPRGARPQHLSAHRLADALRAAGRCARRAAREGLGGLLRAQPALPSGSAPPRRSRQVREGADRGVRADEGGVRGALGPREAGAVRPEPRRDSGAGARNGRALDRPGGPQEARDAEFPAGQAAHRGEGLSPGRRNAAGGRALRARQRRVSLRAVPGRDEESQLDRPGAVEPQGGRAPRQPARGALPGGRSRAPGPQETARGRAVRAPRRLPRPVSRERGAPAAGRRGGDHGARPRSHRTTPGRDAEPPAAPEAEAEQAPAQPSGILSRLFHRR